MKKEFALKPEKFTENYPGELSMFSWMDFLVGIPSPICVVTGYKSNGTENATVQSWVNFISDMDEFICIFGGVNKNGHMYASLKETGGCVINFPSAAVYPLCKKTIENNKFELDEITVSGLTAEKGITVNAPRIKECFLNIECEYLWEQQNIEGSNHVVMAVKAKHISMDADYFDETKLGRYGKTGFIYNINSPRNPETGAVFNASLGVIETL